MRCFRCFYTRAHSLLLHQSSTIPYSPISLHLRRLSSSSPVSSVFDSLDASSNKEDPKIGSRKAVSNGKGWDPGEVVMNKTKKGKLKTVWVCENCGNSDGQWWGSCRECHKVGTMKRFSESSQSSVSGGGGGSKGRSEGGSGLSWLPEQAMVQPHRLTDVIHGITQQQWRFSLYVMKILLKRKLILLILIFYLALLSL